MCGVASFPGSPPHDDGRVGGEPGNEAMCSVRVDMLVYLCRNLLNPSALVCDTCLHISLHVQGLAIYLSGEFIHSTQKYKTRGAQLSTYPVCKIIQLRTYPECTCGTMIMQQGYTDLCV